MTEPMGERGRQGAAPLGGTPGPWMFDERDGCVFTQDNIAIAYEVLNNADGQLLAAAPELLDALRLEHGIEDGVHHEPPCSVCDLDYRIMGEQ